MPKNNEHKKRTFIDRFARRFYRQHARMNTIRHEKHEAKRLERRYGKEVCNAELAESLAEEMGVQYSSGSGKIFIAGNDVTDVPFSEMFSGKYKEANDDKAGI